MGKDWSYLKHVVKADPVLRTCLPSTRGQPNPFFIIQLNVGDKHHGKVEERKTKQRKEER